MNSIYRPRLLILALISLIVIMMSTYEITYAAHAISINDTLKYAPDFDHFEYSENKAQKGGSLVLHDIGSFDKLNPYTLKGISPLGVDSLVFEPLAVSSLDEPFSKYGLLAEDIKVAEDGMAMRITLDRNARFSDGSAVTSEDVLFSLNTMKSKKVHPLYAHYYKDIKGGKIIDQYKIDFLFSKKNRELPLIALDIPIFSKNFFSQHDFGKEGPETIPVGSGPYIIDKIIQGKTIHYRRDPDYWANNKNTRKGMFNFDSIVVKYYKDPIISVEAFKAGEFDVQLVNIAKQWARDLGGAKFESGEIKKEIFPHSNNAGMQCFVFNMRKPLFQDVRVREAVSMAFDFEWTNKSLFFDQYTRNNSYFSNSYLAASGLPQGLELQYLNRFKNELPERVFTAPLQPTRYTEKENLRYHLRKAKKLLERAGWKVKKGKLTNNSGDEFSFEILLSSPTFSRVMAPFVQNLSRLGIEASYRVVDQALFTERVQKFDFDMIVNVFGQSQSPGNEQRNYWHSQTADVEGSGNVAGIKSPVVDYLVDKIIYAQNQDELTSAVRALDRVLWYGFYVIPNWHLNGHRMAFYNKFNYPEKLPKYYNYLQLLMTWWSKNSS